MKSETLSAKDAAVLLGVSGSLFRVYCRAGRFDTARKVYGTKWVIDKDEVLAIANGEKHVDFSGAWGVVYER